jgi:spore maturation protein CgeB
MRIFYAASNTSHDCLQQSTLWYDNLYRPLVDLGHEVIDSGYDFRPFNFNLDPSVPEQAAFIGTHRSQVSEALLKRVRAVHGEKPIDLFFSYFYAAHIDPDVIHAIRDMGIVTVNWYCNASYQFDLVKEIAPAYDYCLVPERFRLADYRQAGANPIYCQEAANPTVYRPYDVSQDIDVSFVGMRYGNRPLYVGTLHAAGIDARAWGPQWPEAAGAAALPLRARLSRLKRRLLGRSVPSIPPALPAASSGPPLEDIDYIKMYSRSRISLGFTSVAYTPPDQPPIKQVRLRDFEATMSGAFYLVEAFDELAEFFEPDKEIVFFDNPAECLDKARFYLRNEAARHRIRAAALKRARAEHTWQHRFQMVFRTIGLN